MQDSQFFIKNWECLLRNKVIPDKAEEILKCRSTFFQINATLKSLYHYSIVLKTLKFLYANYPFQIQNQKNLFS